LEREGHTFERGEKAAMEGHEEGEVEAA